MKKEKNILLVIFLYFLISIVGCSSETNNDDVKENSSIVSEIGYYEKTDSPENICTTNSEISMDETNNGIDYSNSDNSDSSKESAYNNGKLIASSISTFIPQLTTSSRNEPIVSEAIYAVVTPTVTSITDNLSEPLSNSDIKPDVNEDKDVFEEVLEELKVEYNNNGGCSYCKLYTTEQNHVKFKNRIYFIRNFNLYSITNLSDIKYIKNLAYASREDINKDLFSVKTVEFYDDYIYMYCDFGKGNLRMEVYTLDGDLYRKYEIPNTDYFLNEEYNENEPLAAFISLSITNPHSHL